MWNDHSPAVAAFAAARGSREPDDLTSEVFLAVFDRLSQFRGDLAAFRSFVFSIAYRRLVDELRMRGRRGETVELIAEDDPRRASSAEDEAMASLGDQRVIALLRELPSDQRDVMQLRIVADLTVEQISVVLGKRPAAVKALPSDHRMPGFSFQVIAVRSSVTPPFSTVGISSTSQGCIAPVSS